MGDDARGLAANDDETIVDEVPQAEVDGDVEVHRLAANDNETVVED